MPRVRRRRSFRRRLIRYGCVALGLVGGLMLCLVLIQPLGLVNFWEFPLRKFVIVFGSIGFTCLVLGWALKFGKRRFLIVVLLFLVALNASAYLGAYMLTHVRPAAQVGVTLPRPENRRTPEDVGLTYTTRQIPIGPSEWLEAWSIPSSWPTARGTVLLFHGNGGSKGSQLLGPAQVFHDLGFDLELVDFRGSGGSSGNTRTLGVREAKDVAIAVTDLRQINPQSPVILYGISMGSAAILRAVALEGIEPDALVLELPFPRLVDAVRSRFHHFRLPSFPLAELIVLWGGVQHGFNGFTHNPVTFAQSVQCPTLVFHGDRDRWFDVEAIQEIVNNLAEPKERVVFPNAGHQTLISVNRLLWMESVSQFLEQVTGSSAI